MVAGVPVVITEAEVWAEAKRREQATLEAIRRELEEAEERELAAAEDRAHRARLAAELAELDCATSVAAFIASIRPCIERLERLEREKAETIAILGALTEEHSDTVTRAKTIAGELGVDRRYQSFSLEDCRTIACVAMYEARGPQTDEYGTWLESWDPPLGGNPRRVAYDAMAELWKARE